MMRFTFFLPPMESDVNVTVPDERAGEYASALEKLGFEDARMQKV